MGSARRIGRIRRIGGVVIATATLAAGALGAAAVPAAANVVEPFAKRYDASLYGEREQPRTTITNVPARPTAPVCGDVKNTITIKNPTGSTRTGATASWPVTPGSKPVASSGTVTEQGATYAWKGDVRPHGKVTITQRVKASCTAGQVRVLTVTAPGSNCPRSGRGGDDPCTSAIRAERTQARPAPQQPSEPRPQAGGGGALAETGGNPDTLLYAGLATALCALGVLAVAVARKRRG